MNRMRHFKQTPSRQRGYATALGIILMTTMALSIFSLYDVGQVSTHKIRGQNAADASAYSVAVIVSRDLNFMATTNRAMVANQVAIGQMVGLSSYGHMIEQTAFNINVIGQIANLIPGVGTAVARITDALRRGARALKQAFDRAARIVIPINDGFIQVLSVAQQTFHGAMLVASKEVYDDVARRNDPDIESSFIVGAFTIAKFIDAHNDTLERNRAPRPYNNSAQNRLHLKRFNEFADVTIASRDRFLRSRDASFIGVIRELGGNEYSRRIVNNRYVWEWTAMDTMRVRIPPCPPFIGCVLSSPLGWGAGHALYQGRNYNYRRNTRKWGGAWRNSSAASIARWDDRGNNFSGTKSIRPFYDLEEDGLRERGPAMVAVLKKPLEPVRVWKEVAKTTANYDLQPRYDVAENGGIAKDQILSVSKAEPYFSRPHDLWARGDRNIEFGNLYNPFWQPRLIETSTSDKAAVMVAAAGFSL
ncbi:pilus assembly protein TadG-related protein [Arenicella xantha]|uniref:Putative Flp pilus-assembly TadE/G-like protein n=1 Tax=Arenicella xantha TaxID=644221 RepID=A0A395JLT2_9GAMM|nr:pilus assembly protein TadG-related protein [Arenicella xantha]RBP51385.1 putative Flp pilus-assembly TadE/G-like protein [Arenicella xantha]